MNKTAVSHFFELDIRVGEIIQVEPFSKAKKPSLKLWIDFGESIGVKKSSAQITHHYKGETLMNTQIIAVINFPPKQIADFISEVLVLGIVQDDESVVLLRPDFPVENGTKIS